MGPRHAGPRRVGRLTATGARINHDREVDLELDVTLQDQPPHRVTVRSFVSSLAVPRVQPDSTIDVRVDPPDRTRVDPIEAGPTTTAKGHAYTVGELLADEEAAAQFVGGHATTIYLHPRDYHRVHTPCHARVRGVTLVPGRLLPVTAASLARVPRLFAVNERQIHLLDTAFGPIAVVMIAAFGGGHMSCAYHPVDAHPRAIQHIALDPPASLRKGDELGTFHLGSTVVMLTQRGVLPSASPSAVRMGQVLLGGNRT